jgi:DNA polymerase III epsilon subunit-like protein
MIVLDIETSGLDPQRHGMLSLGAVDFATGEEFYGECSLTPHNLCDDAALAINGFKREDISPGKKQPPDELYWKFVLWTHHLEGDRILAGHNIGHFDILFLERIHNSGWFPKWGFGFRTVDLHSVAYSVLHKSLSHSDICRALGIEPEPKPHNALYGARSERAALMELFRIQAQQRAAYELHQAVKNTLD